MKKTENIGYWFLRDVCKTSDGRTIGIIWWVVCKKTRKVALASNMGDDYPYLIQGTHITDNDGEKECYDGESCLNIDCPYAKNQKLIDAINKNSFKGSNTDENLINFFKKAFDNIIYDFIGTIDENTLKEVFEDSYEQSTINKNAFETTCNIKE